MRYSSFKDVKMQDAAVATGDGTAADVSGYDVLTMQISGITTATITFEATIDDVNWVAVQATDLTTGTAATTATADGIYRMDCSGLRRVRARISAWTSGTIDVDARQDVT